MCVVHVQGVPLEIIKGCPFGGNLLYWSVYSGAILS